MFKKLYDKAYYYNIYLCDFKKNPISQINFTNINYSPRFDDFDELEFSVEYYENGILRIQDENYNLTKANHIVYLEIKDNDIVVYQEYFSIDNPSSQMDNNGVFTKSIHCFSLPYSTFQMRRLRGYQDQVRTLFDPINSYSYFDNTKGGILNYLLESLYGSWSVGYINPNYIGVYHTFSFSDNTYVDVIKELETVYNCFILFDSVNNQINIYSLEEVGTNKGLVISHTNYVNSISTNTQTEGLITRLKVFGKDGAVISRYNSTGELFIEDYTNFLNEMSSTLKAKMIIWDALKVSKAGEFTEYVDQLDTLDAQLVTKTNELVILNQGLAVIQANMDSEKAASNSTTSTYTQLKTLENSQLFDISVKEDEITNINNQISAVNSNIQALNTLLKLENNFTNDELIELSDNFIKEDTLTMSSVSDEKQLYDYAVAYLTQKSKLPISLDISMVDIFSSSECSDLWDKVNVGDFIYVDIEQLGYNYTELRLVSYSHNQSNNSLSIILSNTNELNNDLLKLNDIFKLANQTSNTVTVNQDNYIQYIRDKIDIIYSGNIIDTNTTPIKSGNNIINQRGFIGSEISGSGALQIKDGRIIITNDDWTTWHTLLSGNGLYLENVSKTSRTILTPSTGFQIDRKVDESWDNIFYINSVDGSVHLDGGYIELLTEDNLSKILLNPEIGFKIQKADGLGGWTDTVYINNNGNAVFAGSIQTLLDAYVGNNIYLGNMEDTGKMLLFFNDGISQAAYIGFDADSLLLLHNLCGDIDLLTPHNIKLEAAEQVTLSSPTVYLESPDGGVLWLNKTGTDNMYFTHFGSGNIYFNHSGTGVIKFESAKDMSIQSITGTTWILGTVRMDGNVYMGGYTDAHKVLKKSEIEALIPSTPSGATGSFTTADSKTVTVTNGIITSIV